MYFVYKLSHPISGDVCYVGITNNLYTRFKQHLANDGGAPKKSKWVKSLQDNHLIPSVGVIEVVDTIEEACEREKYWIHYFVESGCVLVNEVHMPPTIIVVEENKDEGGPTITVTEIMGQYNISRMTVWRYVKKGHLVPINISRCLRKQHKLLFRLDAVRFVLGEPITDRVA